MDASLERHHMCLMSFLPIYLFDYTYSQIAPTFAALIPDRQLDRFAPSGFAIRACILGRFAP